MNGLRPDARLPIESGEFALGIVKTHEPLGLLDCAKCLCYRVLYRVGSGATGRHMHERPHGGTRALRFSARRCGGGRGVV